VFGTLVNVAAIIVGALAGRYLIPQLPKNMSTTVTAGVGFAVLLIGLEMALEVESIVVLILSLALGGVAGELLDIDGHLNVLGEKIKESVSSTSSFGEAFVTATLIFCVGPMAIMGAIQSGVQGDHSTLFAKSMLDGVTSVVLSSTLGIGVLLSAVPVLMYQGGISLAGLALASILSEGMINAITSAGGLLIVGLSLNMLKVSEIRVANLLPSLLFAPILHHISALISVF